MVKPSTSSSSSSSFSCSTCPRMSKPFPSSPAAAVRRSVLKRIQRQELRRLQNMLPSSLMQQDRRRSAYGSRVRSADPCLVIESAIRYIDQLHATVIARVQNGTLPREVIDRLNLPAAALVRSQQVADNNNNSSSYRSKTAKKSK